MQRRGCRRRQITTVLKLHHSCRACSTFQVCARLEGPDRADAAVKRVPTWPEAHHTRCTATCNAVCVPVLLHLRSSAREYARLPCVGHSEEPSRLIPSAEVSEGTRVPTSLFVCAPYKLSQLSQRGYELDVASVDDRATRRPDLQPGI